MDMIDWENSDEQLSYIAEQINGNGTEEQVSLMLEILGNMTIRERWEYFELYMNGELEPPEILLKGETRGMVS